MDTYIYAISPNGTPIQFGGAARPPAELEIISEEAALQQWTEIEAADLVAIGAAEQARNLLLSGAYTSLIKGDPLTGAEAMALGTRPLATKN